MSNRIIILTLSIILLASVVTSCSKFGLGTFGEKPAPYKGEALMDVMSSPAPEARSGIMPEQARGGAAHVYDQKIIRSASLTVEVRDIEEAYEEAQSLVKDMRGHISDSSSYEDDMGTKSLRLTIRVPSDKLDKALKELKGIGHVRAEDIHGYDITEEYVDMEARLSNAKRLETRLLDLLQKRTTKLKDMLEVEKELARVRETIESMEGRKRFYDSRISMSTIQLTLTQPRGFGRGIFEPLSGCLQRALTAFTSSIVLLVIFISAVLPWIALFLLLAWLTLRFLRFWLKHKRAMKAKKGKKGLD